MEIDIKKELKNLIQQLKSLSYDQGRGVVYERYVANKEHQINVLVNGLQLVNDTKPMEVDTPNAVKDVYFSMNRYDNNGNNVENGVFLHIGDTIVKICESPYDFKHFTQQITTIDNEISRDYM
jgi:hypothetical protein